MQRISQNSVLPKLAFRIVGKELLKEKKFDTSFEYFKRAGLRIDMAASLVSRAAERAKSWSEAIRFSKMMRESSRSLVRQGMMMFRLGHKQEYYREGVSLLMKGGMGKEKANMLGASFAFRNRKYRVAAEMFESAGREKEAKRAWALEAEMAVTGSFNPDYAIMKSGVDARKIYLGAAKRCKAAGEFSDAAWMFRKAGEPEKSDDMLLLNNEYGTVIRAIALSKRKTALSTILPVREACASVAQRLEMLGRLESAAKCYELAWNFQKAKEIYIKLGLKDAMDRIDNFKEPNKRWCFLADYEKMGFSQDECG